MSSDKPVTLAAISGAHGVAGDVRLKLFGEGIAQLRQYQAFNDNTLTLKSIRDDKKGGAIARFAECIDRNAAEALRGTLLTIPVSALPELDEGEYYHSDLLGLNAVSESGDMLGKVVAVENYGAQDVIEIERPDGKRFLIPMTEQAVIEWDDERLVINHDFVDG